MCASCPPIGSVPRHQAPCGHAFCTRVINDKICAHRKPAEPEPKWTSLLLKPRQLNELLYDLGARGDHRPAVSLKIEQSFRHGDPRIRVWLTEEQDAKLREVISDEQLARRYKQYNG